MVKRRATLAIATLLVTGMCPGQTAVPPPEHRPETGTLAGCVVDAARQPVAQAIVILCDHASGIPIDNETFRPFTETYRGSGTQSRRREHPDDPVLYRVTDDEGSFRFENIPVGEYRLVAQSWLDVAEIERLFERNGKQIELHGTAEHLRVSVGRTTDVTVRPLGSGVLKIDQHLPNDETLLVLSTAPTCADPILGFVGWAGPFLQNMLGANRMPAGQTTVFGLPEGTVYFAMFAADNVPGWTEGQVEIRPDGPVVVERIPFVCSWSNGRHQPPAELEALVEEIKALAEAGTPPDANHPLMQLRRLSEGQKFETPYAYQQWLSRHLDHEFVRPSGGKVVLKDLAAASQYVQLQQVVEKKKEQSSKQRQAMARFRTSRDQKKADGTKDPQAPPAIDVTAPDSFFPDDPEAARELGEMWAVKWEALKTVPEGELLDIVRRGLRQTTANRNDIIKTIGSHFVWHKSPSDPLAVDILYAASFEPGLEYDAFYYGLTTAQPKPPYVLDRLVELALDGHEVWRITWGIQGQTDEFLTQLNSRLADAGDDALRHQGRNVVRMIEAMDRHVYDRGTGQIKLEGLRQIREQDTPSREQVRQTLLAPDGAARQTELERVLTTRMYFLFDDAFVPALEACSNDENPEVRSQAAELAGSHWLWGNSIKHPAITRLLLKLSADPVASVRFTALEKGLFNIPDKTDEIIERIIDLALSEEDHLPEKLYDRIAAVLRKNRERTQEILLAYRAGAEYPDGAIVRLYRSALRSDPPPAP